MFGKAILQAEYNSPSYNGGQVDSSTRYIHWGDIDFKLAPASLMEIKCEQEMDKEKESTQEGVKRQ